jgi:hypothetical protein
MNLFHDWMTDKFARHLDNHHSRAVLQPLYATTARWILQAFHIIVRLVSPFFHIRSSEENKSLSSFEGRAEGKNAYIHAHFHARVGMGKRVVTTSARALSRAAASRARAAPARRTFMAVTSG